MKRHSLWIASAGLGIVLLGVDCERDFTWTTVVNNGDVIPGAPGAQTFNSYGQPSVNEQGLVVFRGRSAGGQQPVRGVYARDMGTEDAPFAIVAVGDEVPQPNNTLYNGELAQFNEFPAFPRIDSGSATVATRGQSQPVWTYLLPDATETRVGTAGVYANPGGILTTGAALLGAVRDATTNDLVFPEFQVPGALEGTRFDQFPGAAAVTGGSIVAFKGNFTEDGVGQTGVFYRDVLAESGTAPIEVIARSGDPIPGSNGLVFGSTAPPSAEAGSLVFVGLDNEDAPTAGGIYRAPLEPGAELETLVEIGDPVPGEAVGNETRFTKFGEGLSISSEGRHIAFWGAWGSETFALTLVCPTDGNQDLIAYCNDEYPNGHDVLIPVHQGIFVYDTFTGRAMKVVSTGWEVGFEDFLFWVFSGRPPGTGGGDEDAEEPPRWRSSAFAAVSGANGPVYRIAFKAQRNGVDGIYHRSARIGALGPLSTVVEVGDSGTAIDPEAPAGSLVSAIGIERDGFRDGWLALNMSMLFEGETEEESEGWAGIYVSRVIGAP